MQQKTRDRMDHLSSIGLNPDDYKEWRHKWKAVASSNRKECFLTFEQYVQLAVDAGLTKPEQIGKSIDSYHLGRIGDVGPYAIGNCRFILHSQNLAEQKANGGKAVAMKRSADTRRGRTKETHDYSGVIEAQKKHFLLTSPEGIEYAGSNLSDFCKANDLLQGNMAAVCRGERSHHRGWTGYYIEVE